MRRISIAAAAALMTLTTGAMVPAQSRDGGRQTGDKGDQVRVTGCVTMNRQSNMYVLTASPDPMARAVDGLTEAPTSITYQLVGGQGLQNHIGHREEVVGRIVSDEAITAEAETRTSATARDAVPKDKDTPKVQTKTEVKVKAQTLRVESFRHVEDSCVGNQR
jgi:hypothetical protein